MSEIAPRVFLVGAGPGDPGLLTLRAVECLARADLVVYDTLVPRQLLDHAPPAAERMCVADLPGGHPHRWTAIQAVVADAARAGKTVIRLKGGDPLVFGRGAEEAAELRAAGIPYEIVPGITAACAAAATAEVPITYRGAASAVAFVTGHEDPSKTDGGLDWAALARFPGTLAVYMGMARLDRITQELVAHGRPAQTPAVAVASATTGEQRRVQAPLAQLPAAVRAAGLHAPAVVFIGPSVGLAPADPWFERRPLFGKRVLVTRPREQAGDLVRRLDCLGAVTTTLEAVAVRPLEDWSELDARLARLGDYDWLVFTSANGVRALMGRLRQTGRDVRALGGVRLAAIGPGTAEALRAWHLDADLVPAEYRSEALAAELAARAGGQRILLARADRGRDVLREQLSAVAEVDQVAVYRQVDAVSTADPAFDALRRAELDYITLTSSSIARAVVRALDDTSRARVRAGAVRLATISPVTSAAVAAEGLPVAVEAAVYTMEGLAEALVKDAGAARGEGQ